MRAALASDTAARDARDRRSGAAIRPGPERTCAGCGARSERSLLRRIGLAPDGAGLEWRERGGRGTYLHDSEECRRRFVAGKKRLPGLRAAIGRTVREALLGQSQDAR